MFSKLKAVFRKSSNQRHYSKKVATFIFENPNKYLDKKKIFKIFRYYKKWIKYSSCKSELFQREILYYISVRSYWSNIDDSGYVKELLLYFHRVNMHFMDFLFPGPENHPRVVSPEYVMHFAEFFLRHANRSRLEIRTMRMADLLVSRPTVILHPCEIALDSGSSEMLLVLFRYGALTTGTNCYETFYVLKIVKQLIQMILELNVADFCITNGIENAPIVQCGLIIMRVCPQLSQFLVFETRSRSFPSRVTSRESWKWVINNILPELETRIFQPMTLRHMSRLKIRGVLHERWLLPEGIRKLPLPQSLKNYLDLLCD